MDTSVRWGPPAPGTKDGEEEAAPVHRRVQGRGGQAVGGERQGLAAGGRRARVHANQLRGWRNERLAIGSAEALARQKAEAAELARLRREVERLEQENEILKRAAAFFAREAVAS